MTIKRVERPHCPDCGKTGRNLYADLSDALYATSAGWAYSRCPDPACGLAWLDPTPAPEDIYKLYQTYPTHTQGLETPPLPSRIMKRLRNAFARSFLGYPQTEGFLVSVIARAFAVLHPGGAAECLTSALFLRATAAKEPVLEIGCGNGAMLQGLRSLGWSVEGVEPDPVSRGIAAAADIPVYPSLDDVIGTSRYSAVVLHHVIEHLVDPVAVLRRIRELLKPGGQLVIVTPNLDGWGRSKFGRAWYPLDPPRHLQLYTIGSLARALATAKFDDIRVEASVKGMRSYIYRSLEIQRLGQTDPAGPIPLVWRARSSFSQYFIRLFGSAALQGDELIAIAIAPNESPDGTA